MRSSGKRALFAGLAVLLVLASVVYWQRGAISLWAMSGAVSRLVANVDPMAALPDGLHVGLCGAGSPFPDDKRSGPCTVVVAGKRMFIFDTGAGAARNISQMRLNAGQIEAIFFTHYHSDHIDGLGELLLQRWTTGTANTPLTVHGPQGLEPVLQGFMQAYTPDRGWRIAHHGEETTPPSGFGAIGKPFQLPAGTGRTVLVAESDLEIVAFAVDHAPVSPAVGYRIRYKDRSVVLSGDTRKSDAVAREARGVDLLVHEALSPALLGVLQRGLKDAGRNPLARIMHDVLDYHTTPEQAAEIAQQAGVKALVFNHIVPPLAAPGLEQIFLEGSSDVYSGPIRVGVDGDWFTLPSGSTALEMSSRP